MNSASISSSPRDRGSRACVSRSSDRASRRSELDLLLVDDHLAARYSVWALLHWKRGIRVIATAETSLEALPIARRRRPQVCLISATLGHGDGLALTFRMKHLTHSPRVLIYADAIDTQLAGAAIVAGADGVLWRYADPEQQASVIRRAATGEQHFPDLRPKEVLALLDRVEERDRAIVAMLLERIPPDEVARTLGISARVLRWRRERILKSLGDTRSKDHVRQDERSLSSDMNCQERSRLPHWWSANSLGLVSVGWPYDSSGVGDEAASLVALGLTGSGLSGRPGELSCQPALLLIGSGQLTNRPRRPRQQPAPVGPLRVSAETQQGSRRCLAGAGRHVSGCGHRSSRDVATLTGPAARDALSGSGAADRRIARYTARRRGATSGGQRSRRDGE